MPGTQKVTFGRNSDTDYKSKLAAAQAQAGKNAYIQGVQSVMEGGVGEAVRGDRSSYGNSNIPVNELIQGTGNFSYKDSPGNQPLNDRVNQTGSADTQVSSTKVPQQDPDAMETEALFNTDKLENRLMMMAKGGQGFPGLNDRNREV